MSLSRRVRAALRRLPVRGPAELAKRGLYAARLAALGGGDASAPAPRVLVVMNAGHGNAIDATPCVQALRALWPGAHLTILPARSDLFDGWCVVDRVVFDAADLRGERFDHTVLGWYSTLDAAAAGFDPGEVHATDAMLGAWFLAPEREYTLDVARRLGWSGPTPPLHVEVRPPRRALPASDLRVVVAPGSKTAHLWRNKRWPHWGPFLRLLLERLPAAQVVLVGSPQDVVADLQDDPRIIDTRHTDERGLTLAELGWVMRSARLVVGNDCGPMHVAEAVRAPSVVLFGPTCEVKNGPRQRPSRIVRHPVPCSPCVYTELLATCEDPRCMLDLTPETVLGHALELLGAT